MTLVAFLLIFLSAFLHAGWNFLSKKTVPSLSFYVISSGTAALVCLPGVFWGPVAWGELPGRFWALWAAGIVFEVFYVAGLTGAYRRGDISFVYPLARSLPVLSTAAATMVFGLGRAPGTMALVGMGVLSLGCLLMPLTSWRGAKRLRLEGGSLGFILLAALGTTGYTLFDSQALILLREHGGTGIMGAWAYLFLVEAGLALSLTAAPLLFKAERAEFRRLFGRTPTPHISGVFSSAAYLLILLAMGYVDNVSYVQALRQMSLPLGVLAGVWLLKERPGAPRLTGIAMVLAGLVLTALG